MSKKWTLGKFVEMWIEWRTGTNQFEQAVGTRLKRFKRSMEEINRKKIFLSKLNKKVWLLK